MTDYTLADFRNDLLRFRHLDLPSSLPATASLRDFAGDIDFDREIRTSIGILDSMTPSEMASPKSIDGPRRERIARGSGTTVENVTTLLQTYKVMRRDRLVPPPEYQLTIAPRRDDE